MQHPAMINARMTCNTVVGDDKENAMEIVQKNTYPMEMMNRRAKTVRIKDVNFVKVVFECPLMKLDKNANFNTGVHL